ncbi:hypothetical protein F3157_07910 [Virgibacillus dakarensis]|nr:hypothetical protein [Virgibacillus dakarensis]
MNHQDVLDRFKEINVTDLFGTKKEVKELPNVIRENETIMYATSGFMENNTWLITCTDKRVLFLDKGMIYGLKQVEIPIEKINSVSHKKGLMFGTVIIHHGSDHMEINQINKATLNPLVEAINNEIENQKNKKDDKPYRSKEFSFSVADEIIKFKKLFDEGVITEGEFQAKKKELLES